MFQSTPYALPLALVVAVAVVGAAIAWWKAESPSEQWFAAVQLAVGAWAAGQLVVVSAAGFETKLALARYILPVAMFLPACLLVFTLYYTGRHTRVTRPLVAVLFALPVLDMLSVSFDARFEHHHVAPRLVDMGSWVQLTYGWGPASMVAAAVSWVMVAACIVMMYQKFRRSRNVYRKLSFLLLVTFVVMLAANVASFAGVSPFPHMMALPLSYLFFGIVAITTTTSVRFVRMLPVDRVLSRLGSRFDSVVVMARDFIVEEMDAGVMVLDADRRIVDINTTAKKMVGSRRAVGRPASDVIDVDAITDGGPLLEVLTGDGELDDMADELWVDVGDHERCYEVSVSPLGGDGNVAGYVVMLHDITRQKEREEELREREQELQFQKANLEQQKQQLEHQNERLDQFAGIVSHDLRNPLNVASGHAELVEAKLESGEDVDPDQAQSIIEAQQRMEDIIADALTLARQGKAITDTEAVDLAGVAREAWSNVDTGEAELAVRTASTVESDRDRLLNVFENLFRNSVEHGSSSVTVTVGDTDDGFYVADDGPGIPDDQKEAVLEHGYTTSDEGTGLGLSIVTDVASAHGWTVTVTDADPDAGGNTPDAEQPNVDEVLRDQTGARFEFHGVDLSTPGEGPGADASPPRPEFGD